MIPKKEVDIIGSGVSGLSLAFFLIQKNYSVTIYEKEPRVGGLLDTHETERGLVEQAANAFMSNKDLEEVSQVIGVELQEKNAAAKKRYIYRDGKPRRWPLSFKGSLKLLGFLIKFVFLKKSVKPQSFEKLSDWGLRCLGEEATDYLLSPAIQGIYATSLENLSASLVLSGVFKKKYEKGKLRGSVASVYGMGDWINKMRDYLEAQGCVFKLSEEKKDFREGKLTVLASDLESAKKILSHESIEFFEIFKETKSVSLSSVTLHFSLTEDNCPGFGCLFPEKEKFNALGVLFNHHTFPNRSKDCFSETWIFNDDKRSISQMDKEEIIQFVLEDRLRLRGVKEKPLGSYVFQWNKRIPLYDGALEEALSKDLKKGPLFFAGNYLGNLGLSKIVASHKELSENIDRSYPWEK